MNQSLFQQFAECVKAGKVPGLAYRTHPRDHDSIVLIEEGRPDYEVWGQNDWGIPCTGKQESALLCHHIREWLTGQGHLWSLTHRRLTLDRHPYDDFNSGTQLDWHLQAVVDIAGQEATL